MKIHYPSGSTGSSRESISAPNLLKCEFNFVL